jgi:diguanylate cyclase (GGDEF)-like protein
MTEARNGEPLVLVADDDRVTRAMVSAWLNESGYTVISAGDGDAALAAAHEQSPDLLLVDVTMPGLDGYEVCRAVQASTTVPPPVIFLTAHDQTNARVAGLEAGAVDYIVKPFARAELIARVRAALRTKAERDLLVETSRRDGLTGLLNRREIDVQVEAAVRLADRHARPLTLLLADIDHFKQINDGRGHAAGDEVIREVARRIRASCRLSDVAGRYGGEEFIVILPETIADDAVTTGDKIRRIVSEQPVLFDGHEIPVTLSVGVASWEPPMAAPVLVDAADQALYRAKNDGRNRTRLFEAGS